MTIDGPHLASGKPCFADAELQDVAAADGPAAAWRLAFSRQGIAAPHGVTGPFAVGVRLDDGRIFLAVDRFAIHTLCYRQEGSRLQFATRADSLVDSSNIDPQALFEYLYYHAIPSPRTVFAGVLRLPPGHVAQFESGRLTVTPYWRPSFAPIRRSSFAALRDEFRTLLEGAVANQLDGTKPACFLSGGTDSSTIAGMIARTTGRPAASYSIGFEAEGYDEMAFARIAARRFETEHHEYYLTPDDLVRSIPDVAAHYDQPFGNSSALPAFYCARMARDDGVTRILAGDGGDELFGGNSRYAMQRVFGWYGDVPAPLRSVLEPVFGQRLIARLPLAGKVSRYIGRAQVPMPDRIQSYNLLERLGEDEVLTPAFLGHVDRAGPLHDQRQVWRQIGDASLLDKQLAFDWRYTLAENDLPKVMGTASLAGIAVGFPMLDQRLLDFSLRLPTAYKLRRLTLRWFFKEALRGFLPDEIIAKKKHGFGLPFGAWALRHPGLNALTRESLNGLAARGIVQPAFVRTLMDSHLQEHPGYYGEMIWILMMLEQWLLQRAPDYRLPS